MSLEMPFLPRFESGGHPPILYNSYNGIIGVHSTAFELVSIALS